MNFLVSAGATSEKIDSVRSITNHATGRLGSLVADALACLPQTDRVFYVCSSNALMPENPKAEIIIAEDTASLEKIVCTLLSENDIAAIVHSMAVSDYRVKEIRGAHNQIIDAAAKISSGEASLTLILEPTPKIISLLRSLAPAAIIVGFKLLDNVSETTLIDTAFSLLQKNKCDYVIANDLKNISADHHIAYSIDKDKNVQKFEDKQSIACGIVRHIQKSIGEINI